MKLIRTLLAILTIGFSAHTMAITDDDSIEFTSALGEGNIKVVKKYVTAEPNVVNARFFAWSPIQIAANKAQLDTVKYLIEQGADINYVHPITKMTAFHFAAFSGSESLVKYLAEKGADVNKKLRADVSIIRVIRDEGNTKMVELLMSLGVKDDGCQDEKCL